MRTLTDPELSEMLALVHGVVTTTCYLRGQELGWLEICVGAELRALVEKLLEGRNWHADSRHRSFVTYTIR